MALDRSVLQVRMKSCCINRNEVRSRARGDGEIVTGKSSLRKAWKETEESKESSMQSI